MSSLIGLEREWKQKDAGLRTYTIIAIGSAMFIPISKYGLADVAHQGTVQLDSSQRAAHTVSELGFIDAGVIFTHRGSVKGRGHEASASTIAAAVTAALRERRGPARPAPRYARRGCGPSTG